MKIRLSQNKILREEVEQMSRLKFGEYLTEDDHTDVDRKNQVKIRMDFTEDEYCTRLLPDDCLPTWWTTSVGVTTGWYGGLSGHTS